MTVELRYNTEHQTRMYEEAGSHYIEGYATIFENTYFVPQEGHHERISRSAFDKSLASGLMVESRYNHSQDHILGRSDLGQVKVWTDDKGIRYRVKYNPDDPDHQKVKAKLEAGLIKGSSMAFSPVKFRFIEEDGNDIAEITEGVLYECGPVNQPCNGEASVSVRSQDHNIPSMSERFRLWKETQKRLKKLDELSI